MEFISGYNYLFLALKVQGDQKKTHYDFFLELKTHCPWTAGTPTLRFTGKISNILKNSLPKKKIAPLMLFFCQTTFYFFTLFLKH